MKYILTANLTILACLTTSRLHAQDIQRPVVGINNVQTAVSVPDRGSALLGGVARARNATNQYGFSPLGSSLGRGTAHSSQRVFVTIHDFEAADRRLLSIVRGRQATQTSMQNPRAAKAWNQLKRQQ